MRYSLDDIVNHIAQYHSRDNIFDEEESDLMARVSQYDYFILDDVLLSDIYDQNWNTDPDLVNEYREYSTSFPPIVLNSDKTTIIDGTHRVKAAKMKGLLLIQAYIGVIAS